MKETEAAGRYARALFQVMEESKASPEKMHQQLAGLAKALSGDAAFKRDLENPLVPTERKKALVRKGLDAAGMSSKVLLNFLDLLISKKRTGLLPLIVSRFERYVEESRGAMKAYVKSASPLDEAAKRQIGEKLTRLFKKKVEIEASVNPELLAGIVVKAGDVLIDNSLRSRLKSMKASIHS